MLRRSIRKRITVPVSCLSPYFFEETDISKVFYKRNNRVTSRFKFDCFLAHEWGTEQTKFATHNTVKNIAQRLRERKLRVWFDEANLRDDVAKGIVTGLAHSRRVAVFVTRRYIERVNERNTNASKEFHCAMSKGIENIIVVVLEKFVNDRSTWFGVFKYHLSSSTYIDFSTPLAMDINFENFCERIRE